MSTPPSKDASVVQSTQKQLDELDALIQKMLELPVTQLEEDPFAGMPVQPLPTSAPARTLTASPRPEAEVKAEQSAAEPVQASAAAASDDEEQVLEADTEASCDQEPEAVDTGEPEFVEKTPAAEKQSTPEANNNRERLEAKWSRAEEAAPDTKEPTEAKRKVSLPRLPSEWYLMPLLWPNRAYDRLTVRCGRTGSWLRGRRGRNLVGWLGVALIAVGLFWALLDWLAWNW